MKEFGGTGAARTVAAAIVLAMIITVSIVATSLWMPGGDGTTTPPTTTPPTTPPNNGGYGAKAMEYLNSRRDDVHLYFICNCTLVNEDLTTYYKQAEPTAYVDGVLMIRNETHAFIQVLFAPYTASIIGSGFVPIDDWEILAGSIIDDGLGQMDDAPDQSGEFPTTWPVTLYFDVFFFDLTFFEIGFTKSDGLVYIRNGTWTGEYHDGGHPIVNEFFDGYWLLEGGRLQSPITSMFYMISSAVEYPIE